MRNSLKLCAILILTFFSFAVHAMDKTLNWATPTTREDMTPLALTEIGGYELRYLKAGDTITKSVVITDNTAVAYTFLGLDQADYTFQIAAYDTNFIYSNFVTLNFKVSGAVKPSAVPFLKVAPGANPATTCVSPNCKVKGV